MTERKLSSLIWSLEEHEHSALILQLVVYCGGRRLQAGSEKRFQHVFLGLFLRKKVEMSVLGEPMAART